MDYSVTCWEQSYGQSTPPLTLDKNHRRVTCGISTTGYPYWGDGYSSDEWGATTYTSYDYAADILYMEFLVVLLAVSKMLSAGTG